MCANFGKVMSLVGSCATISAGFAELHVKIAPAPLGVSQISSIAEREKSNARKLLSSKRQLALRDLIDNFRYLLKFIKSLVDGGVSGSGLGLESEIPAAAVVNATVVRRDYTLFGVREVYHVTILPWF